MYSVINSVRSKKKKIFLSKAAIPLPINDEKTIEKTSRKKPE